MQIFIDQDVRQVLEFIERHVEANRLLEVVRGVAAIAPVLWPGHPLRSAPVLSLRPIESHRELPPSATESGLGRQYAGGGSAVAVDTH